MRNSSIEPKISMIHLIRKTVTKILKTKVSMALVAIVFLVYVFSSFDICWFPSGSQDKGFVFSSNWTEHLHSSEEWTIYNQIRAFYEGKSWLSKDSPPDFSADTIKIGDYYYALAEPATAGLLLPFYALGQLLFGATFLIRSALVGMIFYTCISALLVRKISLQLEQSHKTANLAALLFSFATMAFSYSRLLYPQPIVAMLMLFALVFLFNYARKGDRLSLLFATLFYALTIFAFNAFLITVPLFLYFLFRKRSIIQHNHFLTLCLGILPSVILFLVWNYVTTGAFLTTPRQLVHGSIGLDLFYLTTGSTWLNLGGIFGSLFSPVGIFFVSPILFASLISFPAFVSRRKDETILLASIIVVFWLFISLLNLGGNVERDFWVGGWANIARYMYVPSTLLIILAAGIIGKINGKRSILGAWIVSLMIITGFLANLSYGVRHDLMVGLLKDFPSTSLLVWPYQLEPIELGLLTVFTLLLSMAYPFYILRKKLMSGAESEKNTI